MRQSHKAIERIKHIASLSHDKAIAFLKSERNNINTTMKETKHIPGPWKIVGFGFSGCWVKTDWKSADGCENIICTVSGVPSLEAQAANAALIASAPSLLAENERLRGILGRVVEYVDEYINSDDADLDRIATIADEARLALAEGGAK